MRHTALNTLWLTSVSFSLNLAAASAALAQDEGYDLGTLILSAAGVEVDTLTAPASVTVVTAEELENTGVVDLTDALRNVPGLAVAGAADGENIFMRGMPAEYTLIMVDGKRQNTRESRTNGGGGIEQYYIPPVSMIERVEIVRGPMSSLHGSDAMGGVINIITKPVGETWGGSVTAEALIPESGDDMAQQQLSFHLGGPIVADKLGLEIWGRGLNRQAVGEAVTRGADDRELRDLHARLSWQIDGQNSLRFEAGKTSMQSGFDYARDTGALGYEGVIAGWDVVADLSHEYGKRESDTRNIRINNTELNAKASRSFDWHGSHAFTFGGQYFNARLTDINPGLNDGEYYDFSNSQGAVFAEDIWDLSDAFTLTLGARYTDDERFGGALTPRAYGVWEVASGLFVTGGVSTGYKTPELRQLVEDYYYTTGGRGTPTTVIAGTPDLQPEKSTSYELGLRSEGDRGGFAITAFHTDFRNKIESQDTGETITLSGTTYDLHEYYNVGKARARGVELTGFYTVSDRLELSGSYTYTDTEILSGDEAGDPFSRTPEHQASLRGDWQTPIDGLQIWGAAQYFGDNTVAGRTGLIDYDGYTTLDLGATYALSHNVTLKAEVQNLADVSITSAEHGTAQNGRSLWLAVTAEF